MTLSDVFIVPTL